MGDLEQLLELRPVPPDGDPPHIFDDPDMGDMPALTAESWEADPDDTDGALDVPDTLPEGWDETPKGLAVPDGVVRTADNIHRKRPSVDVTHWSPNRSSRGGAHITLIVVHVTAGHNRPGVADLRGLGDWFGTTRSRVSSHVATDNEANSARYVRDRDKAWHVANFNRMAWGIEQVAPGTGREITRQMYRETARWIALCSLEYGVPIRKARVRGTTVLKAGVIRHSELGAAGGGHADPGPYDLHAVLNLARFYRAHIH
jgi:hypothetical protein